jgi:hypothetical protein
MGGHTSGHLVPQYSDYNFSGKLILWVQEKEANNTVDLWLVRQQILAMQKAYDNVVSPATLQKLSWMNSRISIHLTC